MLALPEIRAPYDGVVTQRNVNTGDFVQPAAGGPKGRPLFVVEQIDPVRVFVNVPGADAAGSRTATRSRSTAGRRGRSLRRAR